MRAVLMLSLVLMASALKPPPNKKQRTDEGPPSTQQTDEQSSTPQTDEQSSTPQTDEQSSTPQTDEQSSTLQSDSRLKLDPSSPLESDEIIKDVNDAGSTWTAHRNFDPSYKMDYLKFLCGLERSEDESGSYAMLGGDSAGAAGGRGGPPENFDARTEWGDCESLREVKEQGDCGSCWAVSTAAAFTDRLCIATLELGSDRKFTGRLSAQDTLTCPPRSRMCRGDDEGKAWLYFRDKGICTGWDYGSQKGCQPYLVPPRNLPQSIENPSFLCRDSCYNPGYSKAKPDDLYKVETAYRIKNIGQISGGFERLKKEIYNHGPVTTGFKVYEDFLSYHSGVYQHIRGEYVGYEHAVKVIGWGTEGTTDYWLVANSWGPNWGDRGFFKIKRGSNECGFENIFTYGYPQV